MHIKRFEDADVYEAPNHWGVTGLRLQGFEDGGPENQWIANNMPRYCSEEYDALIKVYAVTAEPAKRQEIAKRLNDLLMEEGAMVPLIHRGRVAAHSNALGGVDMTAWDSEIHNIENWFRVK